MGTHASAILGRLNGYLKSLRVGNLTVTGSETILGGVVFQGATSLGASAADTLSIAASWPAFTPASIPYFAGDSTLSQDNAGLSYNATLHLLVLGTGLVTPKLGASSGQQHTIPAAAASTLALLSNTLGDFAATTSAQLLATISDETGSGSLVFANTPTLVTPNIGAALATSINGLAITASAGGTLTIQAGKTLTAQGTFTLSATDGATLAIGAGGTLGSAAYTAAGAYQPAGNYQPLDTNLTTLSGIGTTGSGAAARATSPTLVAPTLGAATATSINKVALTAPAAAATLTIANNKTLTVNNTITLAATDGITATFPATSIVVAGSTVALTSGRIPFATTNGLLLDSGNFTFDATNFRVSLGGASDSISNGLQLFVAGTNVGTFTALAQSTTGDLRFFLDWQSVTSSPTAVAIKIFRNTTIGVAKQILVHNGTSANVWALDANAATLTHADGFNYIFGTSTGSKLGSAANEKVAFHGATPVVQRSGAAQAAVATNAAALASFGFQQAQADGLVTLVNELRAAMVEKGFIKGSA